VANVDYQAQKLVDFNRPDKRAQRSAALDHIVEEQLALIGH